MNDLSTKLYNYLKIWATETYSEGAVGSFLVDQDGASTMSTPYGALKVVTVHGGEDMGSKFYIVVNLLKMDWQGKVVHDRNFKIEGYYDSWEGTSWDGEQFREVIEKPVQAVEWVYV